MSAAAAHRAPNYLPLTLLVGGVQMIATMDIVTMGVLLSSIGRDFNVGPVMLSGLISFSALIFASMMLVGGRLADMIGQRSCIAIGLGIAAIGALIACLAPHFLVLIAGRLVYGLGAAIMVPANFSVINTAIPDGPSRHRAYGVFGMVQGMALFLGPGLGGLLAAHFGWRAVFLANAGLMLALLAASRIILPDMASTSRQRQSFDFVGAVLFVPAIIALVLAISGGSGLLVDPTVRIGVGVAGLVLFGLFLHSQTRVSSPLLPLDALHHPGVKSGIAAMLALMGASAGLFILPPLVMQRAMGWGPAQSGFGMIPHAIAVMTTGHFASWFMGRFRPYTNVLLGFMLLVSGLFANAFMDAGHGYVLNVLMPMVLGASGSIFLVITLSAVITAPQPAQQQGVIAAVTFTSQQIGISLGAVALLSVAAGAGDPYPTLNRTFLAAAGIGACGLAVILWQVFRNRST